MQFDVIGKVVEVLPEESGTSKRDNTWRKKSFVLETREQRPVKMLLEVWGDRIDRFAQYLTGEKDVPEVKVCFSIESIRMQSGKYFTSCRAFYTAPADAAAQNTAFVPEEPVEEVTEQATIDELREKLAQEYGVNKK